MIKWLKKYYPKLLYRNPIVILPGKTQFLEVKLKAPIALH